MTEADDVPNGGSQTGDPARPRLEKLGDELNLPRAWRRVRRNSRGDPIPVTIEYGAFNTSAESNLSSLKAEIGRELLPQPLKTVNLVKPNLTLRPCAIPEIPERIYYQALVDLIAEQVDDKLLGHQSSVVFGFGLNVGESDDMFTDQSTFSHFYQRVRDEIQGGGKFMLVTDLASYYETIDHSTLRSILMGLGAHEAAVNELMRILGMWSSNTGRGLPQSLWASDYLGARVFLDRVDKAMLRNNYTYFRYSDDIRILGRSEIELRRALRDLAIELRRSQLIIQGAKTRIYSPADAEEEASRLRNRAQKFLDSGLAWTLEIPLYGYPAGTEEEEEEITDEQILSSGPVLLGLLTQQCGSNDPDSVIIRRCLHGLQKLRSVQGVEAALGLLERIPSLTQDIVRYLKVVDVDFGEVKRRLMELLGSDFNIYGWQEMWLLDYLYRAAVKAGLDSPFDETDLRAVSEIAFDRNRHWAGRVSAINILGRYGDDPLRIRVRDLYNDESQPDIRHSVIRSSMWLPRVDRNRFLSACFGQDLRTDRIISYLRSRPGD